MVSVLGPAHSPTHHCGQPGAGHRVTRGAPEQRWLWLFLQDAGAGRAALEPQRGRVDGCGATL